MNRCQFIEDHRQNHLVQRLCRLIEVGCSSYYKWRAGRGAHAERERADEELAEKIRAFHTDSDTERLLRTLLISLADQPRTLATD
ncbi:hypothetical protein ACFH04_08805 [Streptomyces noboritoensis]|uniref:Transposase n=1 Tax=Streptomyces noboritoensis TaxID=67337 RepID=A0ABV6TDD0_9ACTN